MVPGLLEPEVGLVVDENQRLLAYEAPGAPRSPRPLPGPTRALRTEDGIDVWPIAIFLDALAAGELWP